VGTYCTAGQATDENVIWRMRFECRITKATNTHSEYAILMDFSTAVMVTHDLASTLRYIKCVTLANDQLDAQIFDIFITILYMYMFRAISCSSSGGQIVLIQHLVSSLGKQMSCLKLL